MFSVRIGIDLDGVVFNSENYIASFIELTYMDKIVDGELNFKSSSTKKRYNIPDADFDTILKVYEESVSKSPLMPFVKEAFGYLKSQGHELYIITARGRISKKHISLTKMRLIKERIKADGYCFSQTDKASTCKMLGIDIMIDDDYNVVESVAKSGIKCFQFISDRMLLVKNKNVEPVYNWGEICRKIKIIEKR